MKHRDKTILVMIGLIVALVVLDLVSIILFLNSSQKIYLAIVASSALAAMFLVYLIVRLLRHSALDRVVQEERVVLQKEHMESLQEEQKEIARLQADMESSVSTIMNMLELEKQSEVVDFTQNILTEYKDKFWVEMCNLPLVDAVLHSKLQKCREKDIQLHANVYIPEQIVVEEKDLITIFHNLLNNAIEACERCAVTSKNIYIETMTRETGFYLKMENPGPKTQEGTWKADRKNHGLGLKIVREIVEKCQGTFLMEETDGEYVVTIYFPTVI